MTQRPVILVCRICRTGKGKRHKFSCPVSKDSNAKEEWVDKYTNRIVKNINGI